MRHLTVRLLISLGVLATAGCLEPADERAEFDRHIGEARVDRAGVQVEDGLAHVRVFEPGRLELWAQAPVLDLELDPGEADTWQIRVENALADAALELRADDQPPVQIEPSPTDVPTERVWQVGPLEADTTYRLAIAPPDADDPSPWHFAIFADVQERIGGVQDIYQRMAADQELRFCLISGDLTEQGTPEELDRFERELEALPIPCYATLGNHELGHSETQFREHFGRGNFSFAFRGARFTLIDSASATLAPLVYRWLDDWLAAGRDRLHAMVMHIPPLDPSGQRNGGFASRAEANKLIHRMADHGVDLSVYGHVHSYYAYSHAGIPAYISGGGGAIPQRLDGIDRHYLKVRADPARHAFTTEVVHIDD